MSIEIKRFYEQPARCRKELVYTIYGSPEELQTLCDLMDLDIPDLKYLRFVYDQFIGDNSEDELKVANVIGGDYSNTEKLCNFWILIMKCIHENGYDVNFIDLLPLSKPTNPNMELVHYNVDIKNDVFVSRKCG